ncbi:50S ribosomal protein L18e [Candidatus Woesearchaeota archaeon]|nr:50S ribosomal protein L18e [Candidatus Woesearchaeota archaeon]
MKRTGPTNIHLQKLIRELKKKAIDSNIRFWKVIAKELEKPTRKRRRVNLYKINKSIRKDETAVVPGKVLSLGEIDKKIIIAGLSFSEKALDKINKAGSKALSIEELFEKNPEAKKVRIIG